MQTFDKRLEKLKDIYKESLFEKANKLKFYLQKIETDTLSEEDFGELHRTVHGLAGSGKTFGFNEISETARELDIRIKTGNESIEKIAHDLPILIEMCLTSWGKDQG